MNWFFFAVIGHLANGVAFIIDKILLRTAFSRASTYAGLVGILSIVVFFAAPWVQHWPQGLTWLLAITSGAMFVLALWSFFAALARAEASRIVPIVGSLIPILTLAGAFTFLGERLTDKTFVGFALLILATIILSRGGNGRPTRTAVWLAVTSAFLFAISSVTGKAAYDAAGFLGAFVTSRLAAAGMAFLLLAFIDPRAGREVLQILQPKRSASSQQRSASTAWLAMFGQGLGAVGFLFVQWATAQGSASVVNAMQAIQYSLLVLVAFALRHRSPHLLGETFTRNVVVMKTLALALAAAGMFLVV